LVNSINRIKNIETSKNIIVIPFKEYHPKIPNESSNQIKLLASWLKQKLYLDIENDSGQKISMILTLENINAHSKEDIALIGSDEKYNKLYTKNVNDICSFNYQNSQNFKCLTPYNIFLIGRDTCCIAEEKIIFYTDESLKEKKVFPFKFIHSTNETNICLFASLQKHVSSIDKTQSFIDQLKILSGSKAYTWTLKYTSPDKGLFIFGDIIDNDKIIFEKNNKVKNEEKNFVSIYSLNVLTSRIFWKIKCDKLIFGNILLGNNIISDIDTEIPFILLKKDYYQSIINNLFNKYLEQKICSEFTPEYQLSTISCNKKIFFEKTDNLKSLPSLIFQINQYNLNLTFTPNDLFRIEGDDIYFMVAYHSYKESQSILGLLFLKKYPVIFDDDSKLMKIMRIAYDNEDNDENNIGTIFKVILIIFLIIILSGIIFGFIGLKYGKKIYQVRKKKANELDDNYDYTEYKGKKDINYDKKYGLLEENKNNGCNSNNVSLEMTKS
jgi:hypothetical protein